MEQKICGTCNGLNDSQRRFCAFCGNSLADAQTAAFPGADAGASATPPAPDASPTPPADGQPNAGFGSQNAGFGQKAGFGPNPPQDRSAPSGYSDPGFNRSAEYGQAPYGAYGYGPQAGPYGYGPGYGYGYGPGYPPQEETVDGIPVSVMSAYLGTAAPKYLQKFVLMSRGIKNTVFNGAVFALGFFFGPLGMSIWFFKKRIRTVAWILFAVGTLFAFANIYVAYRAPNSFENIFENFNTPAAEYTDDVFEFNDLDDPPFNDSESKESFEVTMKTQAFSAVLGIPSLVLAIVMGIYANTWYKRTCCEEIRKIAASSAALPDPFILQTAGRHSRLGIFALIWMIVLLLFEGSVNFF